MHRAVTRFWQSLCSTGLGLATLFFVASLTPTLIPRTYLMQGVLSGACFAAGYGLGVLLRALWDYMELPTPRERFLMVLRLSVAVLCAAISILFLWRAAGWQNSIRQVMDLELVPTAHPWSVCAIAIATFLVLIALARLFKLLARLITRGSRRFVTRPVSRVLGIGLAAMMFWMVANGVIVRIGLNLMDSSFAGFDALIEPERQQPLDPVRTGSPASLIDWKELGRAGREFVSGGPRPDQIAAATGGEALAPIRVYVGLGVAQTAQARAAAALAELQRVGAFDRSVLVVITPTGTGWIDPAAIDTLEYLHRGDVASVALQYSYLSSPLSLLVEPGYGSEAAQALFSAVYGHWTTLPSESRPKLYLHGLSLGAMFSETSTEIFEILADPFQGALWSGPPFESRIWRSMVNNRNEGSPAWLPEVGRGTFVRFMNQQGGQVPEDAPWGPIRIVYLQYASDPVTFFDPHDLYREPAWMDEPRGPDVSPELRWYPVVTMLQLAFDMAMATTAPMGHGHVYAPEHYVDAWVAVTDPPGWSAEALKALKAGLSIRPSEKDG